MFSGRIVAQSARTAVFRAPIASRTAFRTYATPAASQNVKPPIAVYGVDGTYATALYTAAAKTSTLDNAAKALENLANAFKKDAKLQEILKAPMLSAEDKKGIIDQLQRTVGGADKGDTVKNFLNTLAENNRLGLLEPITEKFGQLMSASRGEVELTVTSAAPLDNRVLRQLENTVSRSQYVGQGKKLKVVPKVNPDIRGGLVVEIGDRTIDLSVSSKISRMNKLLRDTI